MALTIDELNIQIVAETTQATQELQALIGRLKTVQSRLNGLGTAGKNAGKGLQETAKGASKVNDAVDKQSKSYDKASKSTKSYTDKLAQQISKFRTLYGAFKSAANIAASWFNESNDYIETLNLFNVTMGEGADAAYKYAESVQNLIGIDIKDWMQYQGVFKNLTTGFGVAAEDANKMSQNLTQLSYDMASFFNTDVETAFDKLSSAMSGQVKGLREFGIDTTVASLQEYALAKGIDAKVRSMTQAEKSMLRYNYIMEKSIIMQGDMARTLVTPANALRILNAQLTQMKRAFGNIISVIVTQFIPYIQVMVQVLTDAANWLANFFGFELPKIDYSGLGGNMSENFDEAEDSLDGVSDKLKEIKKQLMGFDELNIITNPDTNSGSSSGSTGVGGALNGMKPLEYDFLSGLDTSKLDDIKDKMKGILEVVGLITTGLSAWKVYNFWKELDDVQKKMVGITLMIVGFSLEYDGAVEIGNGTAGLWDYIKTAIGAGLGIAGSLIVFGTGPLGWTIGITAALSVFLIGFTVGYDKKQLREDLENRFGEIALSMSDIKDYAAKLTTSDLSLKINLYVEEKETLDDLKKQLESSLSKLQGYNFRAKVGLSIDENSYEVAVDNYIQSATDYLTQKQVVAAISVDILLGGTSTGDNLTEFASTFYSSNQQKLTELGKKLKNTVESGFKDGVWIEDKLNEAIKLQKEIQEIVDYVSDVEYQAKLKAIKLDATSLDMDANSFKGILEEAQKTIEEKMESLEGIRLETLKVAQMQYDQNILDGVSESAAKQIYDTAVSEAQKAFEMGKLELNYGSYSFGIDTIKEKYKAEIEKTIPLLQQSTQDLFMSGTMAMLPDETYENLDNLFLQLHDAYYFGFRDLDISSAARQNIEELLEALKPQEQKLKEVADEAIAAGKSVPENVAKGLNDINQLKAISGSLEATNYMIGAKLSTDPSFIEALNTANFAGSKLDAETARGLLSNLQVVEDAANGTVTLMNDTIGEKTFEVTPELVANMQNLGVNLSDGLLAGAQSEQEKNKSSWKDWAIWPWNWFKEKNEIHSPSKLFQRGGNDIMQGLWNGLKEIWNKITTWWSKLGFPEIKFKMPHFSWSTQEATGWKATVLEALGLPASIPKLDISWYASGGLPSVGEMFVAREAGPELVGSIGRKTAVANNDQIVSGIESGVYRAMVAANSQGGGSGNQTIRIINEIDGDIVGEKVIKYHNGKVMQTGVSPLLV